jgi:alpha-beta hydrolase superfamily lysophospholipase
MAARLPRGDFRLIERGAHELLMECPSIRQEVFDAFSARTGVQLIAVMPDQSLSA